MATCLERWLPGAGLPHDHRHGHGHAHDYAYDHDYDYDYETDITPLAKPIFSIFPSSDELRSTAAPRKCSPIISSSSSYASKRKNTTPQPSPARLSAKRSRFHPHSHSHSHLQSQSNQAVELHQSTCLNLTTPTGETSESDLWILPDFDEWEFENDAAEQESKREDENEDAQGTSTSLLQRAVQSNRERLRRKLEGDGWDFVGGRYGEGSRNVEMALGMSMVMACKQDGEESKSEEEESVDEEFDVVVLPIIEVAS